jgi:hypothetical protein
VGLVWGFFVGCLFDFFVFFGYMSGFLVVFVLFFYFCFGNA